MDWHHGGPYDVRPMREVLVVQGAGYGGGSLIYANVQMRPPSDAFWLRQLQPVTAHLGAPPVYVGRFVQTHVRVYQGSEGIEAELWEHPRPSPPRLRVAERLAVAGRMPTDPDPDAAPQKRARMSVGLGRTASSGTVRAPVRR